MKQFYDHIFIVTNNLSSDRRVARITNTLVQHDRKVLLIGRKTNNDTPLRELQCDTDQVTCFFNKGPLFYLEYNLRVTWMILMNYRTTSLTCNDVDTALSGILIKKLICTQLILDYHEWFEEVPELKNHNIKKSIWRRLSTYALKESSARYTVNKYIATAMTQTHGYEFEVVHNIPKDDKCWSLDKSKDVLPFKLAYLGVLNEGRGLPQILKAIEGHPMYELYILGTGDIRDQIKQRISLHDVQNVHLLGHVAQDQFYSILSQCHVGINLLEDHSLSYYYSSANKLFDYINYGLEVLTMNFPFYKSVSQYSDMVHLVEDLSKETLINKLETIRVHYDPSTITARRERLLTLYNWSNEEHTILRLYKV